MPPNIRKLTPFEKRLRRNHRLRAFGHEPAAPNCFWHKPEDMQSNKAVCETCVKLREEFPSLNRVTG